MSDIAPAPAGWIAAKLDSVAIWRSGGTPSRAIGSFFSGSIPWFKTGELGTHFVHRAEESISEEGLESSSARLFPKGAVAFAMYGATIGKVSILGVAAATNQACAVGVPDAVSSEFLYRYLTSQAADFARAGKGGAQPNISQGIVKNWPILVPPEKEQTRIVDKLEELFTDLDAGVAELHAAQKKLGQYRQSLLKAAVEGALTAEWRRTNVPAETGTQLLARILKERRARWETKQLAKFEAQERRAPKGWQDNFSAPTEPESTGLPELPIGWTWASIEQIAKDEKYCLAIGPFGSNLKVEDYRDSGVPLVFVRNIRASSYGTGRTKYVSPEKAAELAAHAIKGGDVLITKMGEPPGDADLYPVGSPAAIITADCIKVRCEESFLLPRFLVAVINSYIGKRQIEPITQGVAQKKVSLGRFSSVAVPIPPLGEQTEIVRLIDSMVDALTPVFASTEVMQKQAAAQRQLILRAAFSGQLVPQDRSDEPASVLLARIRAERASAAAKGGGSTTPRKRKLPKEPT